MDVLPTLTQIVAVFSVTILPFVLIVWSLAGRDPDPVSDVIVSPRTPWPHGVQEEDGVRWHVRDPDVVTDAFEIKPVRPQARVGLRQNGSPR